MPRLRNGDALATLEAGVVTWTNGESFALAAAHPELSFAEQIAELERHIERASLRCGWGALHVYPEIDDANEVATFRILWGADGPLWKPARKTVS